MRVLVLGAGSREHALVRALRSAHAAHELFCAPGNAGIAREVGCHPVALEDPAAVCALARELDVQLVVVGPEAPLVAGVADALRAAGIAVFGPGREAAQLEGSKVFTKRFLARHGVPTAGFEVFDEVSRARAYLAGREGPIVVKADGLAAGKGVVVAKDSAEALEAVEAMMVQRAFGSAGATVVLEECLTGPELSLHVLLDGEHFRSLGVAQDHKRLLDGDRGPNTGGMGAYAPVPFFDAALEEATLRTIVEPTVAGLAREGLSYRGVLFIGLMVQRGVPQVLEFNVRFGDPECAVLMARLGPHAAPLLAAVAQGRLKDLPEAPRSVEAALAVVLAAEGYPAAPRKGVVIEGLERAASVEGVTVLHAATAERDVAIVTDGGRVLAVTAVGATVEQAAERAYEAAGLVRWPGMQCRTDIGWQARLTREAGTA